MSVSRKRRQRRQQHRQNEQTATHNKVLVEGKVPFPILCYILCVLYQFIFKDVVSVSRKRRQRRRQYLQNKQIPTLNKVLVEGRGGCIFQLHVASCFFYFNLRSKSILSVEKKRRKRRQQHRRNK